MSVVRSETKAVRSLTKSIKSVMGITSHQMEGAARHMELPPTIPILPEPSYIYEYMFVFQEHRPRGKGAVPLSHYSMTVREFCLRMVASMCLGTAWTMQLPIVALAAALAALLPFLVA